MGSTSTEQSLACQRGLVALAAERFARPEITHCLLQVEFSVQGRQIGWSGSYAHRPHLVQIQRPTHQLELGLGQPPHAGLTKPQNTPDPAVGRPGNPFASAVKARQVQAVYGVVNEVRQMLLGQPVLQGAGQ